MLRRCTCGHPVISLNPRTPKDWCQRCSGKVVAPKPPPPSLIRCPKCLVPFDPEKGRAGIYLQAEGDYVGTCTTVCGECAAVLRAWLRV